MKTSWKRIGFFIIYSTTVCVIAALMVAGFGGSSGGDLLRRALMPCLGCLSLWSAGLIWSEPGLACVGLATVGVVVVGWVLLFPAIST
jgi:hypothetical protein